MRCTFVLSTRIVFFSDPSLCRYASVEASTKVGIDIPLPAAWSAVEVEKWLMVHATAVNAGKPLLVDVDVFEQGFDRYFFSALFRGYCHI